jgi:uncharacterized membrane protein
MSRRMSDILLLVQVAVMLWLLVFHTIAALAVAGIFSLAYIAVFSVIRRPSPNPNGKENE